MMHFKLKAFQLFACLALINLAQAKIEEPTVTYMTDHESPVLMNLTNIVNVTATIKFPKSVIDDNRFAKAIVVFSKRSVYPQLEVVEALNGLEITVLKGELNANYEYTHKFILLATYIGRVEIYPIRMSLYSQFYSIPYGRVDIVSKRTILPVLVFPPEDRLWTQLFVISVSIVVVISYMSLGTQLDIENVKKIVKSPVRLAGAFLVTVVTMPSITYLITKGSYEQLYLWDFGAFVFACGPAATSSTLWIALLNGNKELAVGLQMISICGSLAIMPILIYALETFGYQDTAINVPFGKLINLIITLSVALVIGYKIVESNEKMKSFSTRIFKPLIMIIILFIVVFSSILYWYLYMMVNHVVLITSLSIIALTYIASFMLGYLVTFKYDQAIAIAISSTHKNSGIAFAVLLVTLPSPDMYIAFVPALVQIFLTSLLLYLMSLVRKCCGCSKKAVEPEQVRGDDPDPESPRQQRATSNDCDPDEFVALNVTDVVTTHPDNRRPSEN